MTLRDAPRASAIICRRDAETLLAHVLHRNRARLLAHADDDLPAPDLDTFRSLVTRRAAQHPLQHLTGTQEISASPSASPPKSSSHGPKPSISSKPSSTSPRSQPYPHLPIADVGTGSGAIASRSPPSSSTPTSLPSTSPRPPSPSPATTPAAWASTPASASSKGPPHAAPHARAPRDPLFTADHSPRSSSAPTRRTPPRRPRPNPFDTPTFDIIASNPPRPQQHQPRPRGPRPRTSARLVRRPRRPRHYRRHSLRPLTSSAPAAFSPSKSASVSATPSSNFSPTGTPFASSTTRLHPSRRPRPPPLARLHVAHVALWHDTLSP